MRKDINIKKVHLGVPGTRADGVGMVPYCEVGYQAFKRGALAPVTPFPQHVECKHCLRGMEKEL